MDDIKGPDWWPACIPAFYRGFCSSSSLLKSWLCDLLWSTLCIRESVPVSNLKKPYGLLFFLRTTIIWTRLACWRMRDHMEQRSHNCHSQGHPKPSKPQLGTAGLHTHPTLTTDAWVNLAKTRNTTQSTCPYYSWKQGLETTGYRLATCFL